MIKYILTILLFSIAILGFSQKYWQKEGVKIPAPVCYGSEEVHRSFVKPPFDIHNKLKSAKEKTANIIVIYDDEFEADLQAKAAFQAAVDIWEGLISSSVPIYLYAYWKELDDGVLGSCGPWEFYQNLDFMPLKNTFYPVALVEKMMGEQISDAAVPDMRAQFNKNNNSWYFGTDGNTPSNKYDFLSVVLHEIGHGLGYTGMAQADTVNKTGSFRYGPDYHNGIFDSYIRNSKSEQLINTDLFKNPSAQLYTQFESGYLIFKGQIPYEDGGIGGYPRLYAPDEWDEGSSIYHLNETSYRAGNLNSLMTPALAKAEAIHNPGLLSLGMLSEMGWKFTQIKHEEHPDIENIEDLKKLEVLIDSDYELDTTQLFLISSVDDFANADTVLLTPTATLKKFEAASSITQPGITKYYFSARNKRNQTSRMPGIAPEKNYSITFGVDNTAPILFHQAIAFMRQESLSEEIEVLARDNVGVNSVKVEYFVNKGDAAELTLSLESKDTYKGTLSFAAGSLQDGDSVRYRIIVEDQSINKNTATLPRSGYFTIYIEGTYDPVKTYFTDFNTSNRDFISSDFRIATPTGFDNGALHSLHPYKSPENNDQYYEYKAQLKYPIVIKNGGIITYDEVVLVEPAETGAVFGGDEFWDYVIVEGSKDHGKTWNPLIDGYDSGANSSWKATYNFNISGNNSTGVGKKELYVKREFFINEKGNFEVGDTILLQFRLYSDPFANGWGWCIDNLNIQDPNTGLADFDYSPGELMFYPNPVTNRLVFRGTFNQKTDRIKLMLFNSFGQMVLEKPLDVVGNTVFEIIDMNNFNSGLYFISVEFENGQRIARKLVKN